MTGSKEYQIRLDPKFEKTLGSFLKKHFQKKNISDQKFKLIFQDFLEAIKVNPFSMSSCKRESFPAKSSEKGFVFMKQRWDKVIPSLQGKASRVRLIFVVNQLDKIITLVWIYTHAEFSKRPPEKELQKIIKGITH